MTAQGEAGMLACPFCGSDALMTYEDAPHGAVWHQVQCVRCGSGGTCCNLEEADAIAAWNRRAAAPAPESASLRALCNQAARWLDAYAQCLSDDSEHGAARAIGKLVARLRAAGEARP